MCIFTVNNELTLLCSYFGTSVCISNNFTRPGDKYKRHISNCEEVNKAKIYLRIKRGMAEKSSYYHVQLQIGNLIYITCRPKNPNVQNI